LGPIEKDVGANVFVVQLQVWDTAGQERFRTITQSYYRSAHGVIITYDITKQETFIHVQQWLDDVLKYAGNNVLCLLIGNKKDQAEYKREVSFDEAKRLASHHNMIDVLETSAKQAVNINEAFNKMAVALKRKYEGSGPLRDNSETVAIGETRNAEGGLCSC
jgi:small GTP-binding protein